MGGRNLVIICGAFMDTLLNRRLEVDTYGGVKATFRQCPKERRFFLMASLRRKVYNLRVDETLLILLENREETSPKVKPAIY